MSTIRTLYGALTAGFLIVAGGALYDQFLKSEDNALATPQDKTSEQAATQNNASQETIVQTYNQGVDAYQAQNYEKALEIAVSLSAEGYAPAKNLLGFMYENGHGVTRNITTAMNLYEESAALGYELAKINLASNYLSSKNELEIDPQKARYWLGQLTETENPEIRFEVQRLTGRVNAIAPLDITTPQRDFSNSPLSNVEFYWSVALRTNGVGSALGTGKTEEEAEANAIEKCTKIPTPSTLGILVQKCMPKHTFSSNNDFSVLVASSDEVNLEGAMTFSAAFRSPTIPASARGNLMQQCRNAFSQHNHMRKACRGANHFFTEYNLRDAQIDFRR